MKRWWRLLWIVAASVLPAWPGHGVPVCPLPAAPTAACFGTDPLANGNPIGSGGDSYQYQPLDRLVSGDGGAVLLGCNGDGAWVKKTVGGTTTFYLVDDRNPTGYAEVVEEHQSVNGGAATLTAVYTHGLDLIAQRRSGSVRYFSYDGHGSTRLLTDASGAVTDTYLYDAYGTLLTSTGSTPNNYLYCGEQFDPDLGMYYLRARFYQPQTGRFWTMDSWEGTQTDPLSLHKYLYAADDPVNRIDPSGHMSMPELGSVMANIGTLAARILPAVSNARWMAYARLTPVIEKGWQAIFWADVAVTTVGAAAIVAPEVLNLAADLGTKINRAYTMNTTPIPVAPGGPGGYGITIENIGGQQLEAMGGTYLGGNVKGIDGTLGVGPGNVLVSFKAHDVAQENLIQTIGRDMRNLQALDPAEIRGTANNGQPFPSSGGLGPVAGRIKVIAVPQSQVQYVISPQFINAMRQLAEETKTIPIVRAVRNWPGRAR